MEETISKVKAIFYSGSHAFTGDAEAVNEIAFLLDEGYLTLERVSIGDKTAYGQILNAVLKDEHAHMNAAGGGKNHVALKLLAKEYLQKKGVTELLFEHPFCGYYPDVMSADTLIIAECGHTNNPEKMLAYFQQGNIHECMQIPYPMYEDKEILGYCFTAGPQLKEFLDFLEAEKRNQLRKFLKK